MARPPIVPMPSRPMHNIAPPTHNADVTSISMKSLIASVALTIGLIRPHEFGVELGAALKQGAGGIIASLFLCLSGAWTDLGRASPEQEARLRDIQVAIAP